MVTSREPLARDQVREELARLIGEIVGVPRERITDSATVEDDLRMESVAFVEMQVAIEEAYNIQIDPIHVLELNEFGAIVDYIYACAVDGTG